METVEKQEEILTSSKNPIIDASIANLSRQSIEFKENSKQVNENLQSFYAQMAIDTDTSDIAQEVKIKKEQFTIIKENAASAYRQISVIDDEIGARWKDVKKSRKRTKLIKPAPSNTLIDVEEELSNHFAHGLNIYKLLVILIVGSFAGVVLETLWCLITRGYIESRAGLVYGPFNLLYGAGAVCLTAALYKYRNRSSILAFIGGFIVGSILEYACSWAQELLVGSTSWDYSSYPFNLNGRICLEFSFFWGILGVFWIKNIYPRMAKMILKIPNFWGKVGTWIMTIFLCFNMVVSSLAVYRWSQREKNIAASNSFWQFIDERFDNSRMERIYANMEFENKN